MLKSAFRKLKVWQKAHALNVKIYRLTEGYPRNEMFRRTHQICKASSSVAANIAEAEGRFKRGDQVHFLHIARGSAYEVQNHLALSKSLGYVDPKVGEDLMDGYDEVCRMLNGLIRRKRSAS